MNSLVTIENSYEKIKEYIDTKLNKDKTLFKTSNDEPTPLDCCEEMLNKIPKNFWSKKDLKILDPCAGYGNFEIILHNILKEQKSTKDILEKIITFNEINEKRITLINKIFCSDKYKLNITKYTRLDFEATSFFEQNR